MSTGNLVPSKAPCPCNLKTDKSKHWQSLCDTCDISYTCMTRHVTLQHAYSAFNGWNSLAKRLSALIECFVTSMTAHCTLRSSNRIGMIATIVQPQILSETCDQPFISVAGFYTSTGIPLASWNRQPLSSHQIPPILSTSSGIMSICDWQCRTLHLPGSLSQLRGRGCWTDATSAANAFSGNYKIVHQP